MMIILGPKPEMYAYYVGIIIGRFLATPLFGNDLSMPPWSDVH